MASGPVAPRGERRFRSASGRAPRAGGGARGELLLRIMASAARALWAAACTEAAAEAERRAEAPHRGRAVLGGGRSVRGARADPALPAASGFQPPGTSFVSAQAKPGNASRGRVVVAAALPLLAPPRRGPAGAISEGAISSAPRGRRCARPCLRHARRAAGDAGKWEGKEGQARSAAAPWRRSDVFVVAGSTSLSALAFQCS